MTGHLKNGVHVQRVIKLFNIIILGGLIGGCATHSIPSVDRPMRTTVTTLMTQALPDKPGTEARVMTVEYPPGVTSPAHRHPGVIFAYVLEGAVECGLDDGPVVRYEKGQSWYERPGQLHRVAKNASQTEPAKLLVFFLTEPGKPVLEREK